VASKATQQSTGGGPNIAELQHTTPLQIAANTIRFVLYNCESSC